MASAALTFNILSKYNDRGTKQAKRDFDGLSRTASRMRGLLVGGLAAAGGATLLTSFVKDAAESAKVARITENAIKATGGAAKVTASQVGTLSTALSNKTAVDDELVQSGANLLLTFKNIRNEAGRGNDIFNQATAAALDLSAAGFGSVESASKMLGKALNDPLKGMTALGRAGVTFTDQQKEQIKTLTEAGDVLGAQKIIMQEVASQVGGAAAAAANPMERLKVIAGNLGEQIGGYLLPWVEKASVWLGTNLPKALEKAEFYIGVVRDAFNDPDVTSEGFVGFLERVGVAAREAFDFFQAQVLPRLKQFGGFLKDTVVPALMDFASWLGRNRDVVLPVVAALGAAIVTIKVISAVTRAWAAAQMLLNIALNANPIGLIVLAVAALVAALVIAYKKSETFRDFVQKAWEGIQKAVSFAWNNVIKPALAAIADFIMTKVVPAAEWLWKNVIVPAFKGIAAAVSWAWDNVIKPAFEGIVNFVRNVLAPVAMWLWNNVIKPVWAGISFAIKVAWNIIKLIFDAWMAYIKNVVAPVVKWLWRYIIKPVWEAISGFVSDTWNKKIKPVLKALGDFIKEKVAPAFKTGVALIKSAWDSLRAAAITPINFVITTVYMGGIKKVFDAVAKAVGSSARLPAVSPISMNSGPKARGMLTRAKGGRTPPGMVLVGEEGPELVKFGKAGHVFTAAQTKKMMATDYSAMGGIGDVIGKIGSLIGGGIKAAAGAVIRPLLRLIPGAGVLGTLARAAAGKAANMVLDWIGRTDTAAAGSSPGATAGWTRPLRSGTYRVGMPYLGYPGHYGADYPAATGTPVYAAKPGTVARALSLRGSYGKHIFLNHAGRWSTRYAHLSQLLVGAGQSVRAGQLIGKVGSTGNSTGPHLHFEVRYNGGPRNPRGIVFDQGGFLPPGLSLAYNGTGRPERVLPPSRGGGDVHYHIHAPNYVGDKRDLVVALEQLRRSGRLPVVA